MNRRELAVTLVGAVPAALPAGAMACGAVGEPPGRVRPWPAPGQVIHTVFVNSRGMPAALEDVRLEEWRFIGADGKIDRSRSRIHDGAGRLEYESFFDGAAHRAHHVQFLPPPVARWTDTPGPRASR